MCAVSFVGDAWGRTVPDRYPWVYPTVPTVVPEGVSRAEFEALRTEMSELRKLLVAAKAFDAATGQPDCEMDEKVELIKRLAALVGVDFDGVLAEQ